MTITRRDLMLSGLAIGAIFFLLHAHGHQAPVSALVGAAPPLLSVLAIAAYLNGAPWATVFLKRLTKHDVGIIAPKARDFLWLLAVYGVSWLFTCLGGVFAVQSLGRDLTGTEALMVGTSMAAGWTAGLAAFMVPGGFGVREGIMFLLLKEILGTEVALGLSILTRLIFMACEAGLGLTAMTLSLRAKR